MARWGSGAIAPLCLGAVGGLGGWAGPALVAPHLARPTWPSLAYEGPTAYVISSMGALVGRLSLHWWLHCL